MYTTRLIALMGLTIFAQSALANTIWLKDRQGNVCYNSASSNPGQVIGYGGINRNGSGFTFTISNPAAGVRSPATGDCANIPTTTANLVFPAGNVVANVVPVSFMKPGTQGVNECLNQGSNLSGVTGGASVGTGSGRRTLAFSFTGTTGCLPGSYQAPFARTVSIATGAGPAITTVYRGNYHIFNEANPIPEPGSILLILVGALGLGFLAKRYRRSGALQQTR